MQFYVRNNFLSATECQALCAQIDAGSYPSPLYEKDKYEDVRTSDSCNLNVHDPLDGRGRYADRRSARDRPGVGRAAAGAALRVGQRFKEHADFFYIDQPYWAEYEPHGGQRTWTAMIYLNQRRGAARPASNISTSRSRRRSGGC